MDRLKDFLQEVIGEDFIQAVLSGKKNPEGPEKCKVRLIEINGIYCCQFSERRGKQEFHENCSLSETIEKLLAYLTTDLKQMQLDTETCQATVLVSKKGNVTIKRKTCCKERKESLAHNRKKQYLLKEGIAVPFLVDLGVMTAEGRIVNSRYDKFRQINRYLEFVEDICPVLEKKKGPITIIDFGCGKSYLTFALYYYLKLVRGMDIRIIGLDLKEDVIRNCAQLARKYGYDQLSFRTGDIADYEGVSEVDLVVTLHACDTATDYALEKAVAWNASAILSVPCCQHELNGQLYNEILEPVLKYGLVKERIAALVTDALRADRLEQAGYQVQILEFIDMEHTPKNILIRAVKSGSSDPKEIQRLTACMEFLHVDPTLNRLLNAKEEA